MCKEMPFIPVNRVVDPKRIIREKWRAEEVDRHKGLLTNAEKFRAICYNLGPFGIMYGHRI
jgi:hypothetical protein